MLPMCCAESNGWNNILIRKRGLQDTGIGHTTHPRGQNGTKSSTTALKINQWPQDRWSLPARGVDFFCAALTEMRVRVLKQIRIIQLQVR